MSNITTAHINRILMGIRNMSTTIAVNVVYSKLSFLYQSVYCNYSCKTYNFFKRSLLIEAVVQLVRALAPEAEGSVFESQLRQTYVVITYIDSSIAKRSVIGVNVTGSRR